MPPEILIATLSGAAGAFAGLSRALARFNDRVDKRFKQLELNLDRLEDRVINNYVLKEDFLREVQAVHNKLDRILDHLIATNQ
jgi:hypothetical protein